MECPNPTSEQGEHCTIFVHTLSTWTWLPDSQFSTCVLGTWNAICSMPDVVRGDTFYISATVVINVNSLSQISEVSTKPRKKADVLPAEWGRCMSKTGEFKGLTASITTDLQRQVVQAWWVKQVMSVLGTHRSVPIHTYLCKRDRNQEMTECLSCHDYISLLLKSIISEHALVSRQLDLILLNKARSESKPKHGTTGSSLCLVVNMLPDS